MKLSVLLAAAGLAVGALGATGAQADRNDHHGGWHGGGGRHGYRQDFHGRGYDRRGFHGHRHCRTFWRHHHRVTRCY